jgi:CubicO group peptidase (beta-lactamase class C family)
MLAGGVLEGARVLGAGTVAHMTSDHLGRIPQDTPSGQYLLGEGRGFGLGVAVRLGQGVNAMPGSAGDWDWAGAQGTQFVVDPAREMVAVLMVNQRNQFDHMFRLFRTLVYQTPAR